jgi:hypothetical protein
LTFSARRRSSSNRILTLSSAWGKQEKGEVSDKKKKGENSENKTGRDVGEYKKDAYTSNDRRHQHIRIEK